MTRCKRLFIRTHKSTRAEDPVPVLGLPFPTTTGPKWRFFKLPSREALLLRATRASRGRSRKMPGAKDCRVIGLVSCCIYYDIVISFVTLTVNDCLDGDESFFLFYLKIKSK